jgi:hypothetical protein
VPGQGLQFLPLQRIPEKWDPVWFAQFCREVLALADTRNAAEGAGITITGQPGEVATISASQDVQNLLLQTFVLATPSGFLQHERTLAGETDVVEIDDGGDNGSITVRIKVGGLTLGKLHELSDAGVLGNPTIGAPGAVQNIQASANGMALGIEAGVVEWTLTPTWLGNHKWNDGFAALFGTDGDLSVSHNGTGATIENATGDLAIVGAAAVEISSLTYKVTTNGVGRLEIDDDGAWLLAGAHGTAGQAIKSQGAGMPPVWGDAGGEDHFAARVYDSAAQTIADSTEDSTEFALVQYDLDTMFNIGTPTLLTTPANGGGWWVVNGGIQWDAAVGGVRRLAIRAFGQDYGTTSIEATTDNDSPFMNVCAVVPIPPNATIELVAYQESGGALDTVSGKSFLSVARVFEASITGPDDPPVSPDAMDDEFEGSSLDPKWTWRNQNSGGGTAQADFTEAGGTGLLESGSTASSPTVQAIEQSFTGDAQFRCKLTPTTPNNFNVVGLFLRDSSNGRSMVVGCHHNSFGQRIVVIKFGSDTGFSGTMFETANPTYPSPRYFLVEVNGGTLDFKTSTDGINFTSLFSEGVGTFITPDTVMLGVVTFGGANRASIDCEWFRRTA